MKLNLLLCKWIPKASLYLDQIQNSEFTLTPSKSKKKNSYVSFFSAHFGETSSDVILEALHTIDGNFFSTTSFRSPPTFPLTKLIGRSLWTWLEYSVSPIKSRHNVDEILLANLWKKKQKTIRITSTENQVWHGSRRIRYNRNRIIRYFHRSLGNSRPSAKISDKRRSKIGGGGNSEKEMKGEKFYLA